MTRTCLNIVTCNTWLVLFFVFLWGSIFYVEHCYFVLYVSLFFCKNHIYFTIFVDKKKKPIWFWLYFSIWIGLLYDLFTPPLPPPVLIMSKRSVQRQRITSSVTQHQSFDTQLILILIHLTHFIWRKENMKVLLYSWKTLEILPCRIEAPAACPRRCSETWI